MKPIRLRVTVALVALMECGSFGVLETFEPTLSSLIWTSIATGKQPPKHGITGLTRKDPSDASQQLFNNRN